MKENNTRIVSEEKTEKEKQVLDKIDELKQKALASGTVAVILIIVGIFWYEVAIHVYPVPMVACICYLLELNNIKQKQNKKSKEEGKNV